MKADKYQKRFYRKLVKAEGLRQAHIVDKESDLQVYADRDLDQNFIKERIGLYRRDIENYIIRDPRFMTSLKPVSVELNSPAIVKEMCRCALAANVGPMAAVAGAIAQFLGRDLLKKGCKEVIIENGGDIFLKINKARAVGIYAGRSKLWRDLSLKISACDTPLGICTSSGTVGHSLSFGSADSVTVLAKSASLADAAATAVGNRVQSKNDLQKAVDFARSIKGVLGVAVIMKKNLIAWGKVEFTQ